MTAPTLTRIGVLRTAARGYYDACEQNASMDIHTIEGLRIVVDQDGAGAVLFPGTGYELRPNDGWALDRTHMHQRTEHWAHLVDVDGNPATELPLMDGTWPLDRARSYVLRQEGWRPAWLVYQS